MRENLMRGLAATLVAIVLFVMPACQFHDDGTDQLEGWAQAYCIVSIEYAAAVFSLKPVDPTTLTVEGQIEQIRHMLPRMIDALGSSLSELKAIDPPAIAQAYHDASITHVQDLMAALESSLVAWNSAATAQDLNAAHAASTEALVKVRARLLAALRTVDPTVFAALERVPDCSAALGGL